MPLYTFRSLQTGEEIDESYPYEGRPSYIKRGEQVYERVPATFRLGNEGVKRWEQRAVARGARPYEAGMERELRWRREERLAAQEKKRVELVNRVVHELYA